ncbi:eukaryotic translation initiation factor 3c [Medicago truncatula]|uniref:Eukaryotic translation initiation factor 3c n=1 Tax=Medicago truncatula TaxID=3880 RepID=G7KKL0_MEDTR|nr:eukaryotic translation initiation factor 3c [Medicago truncatula]
MTREGCKRALTRSTNSLRDSGVFPKRYIRTLLGVTARTLTKNMTALKILSMLIHRSHGKLFNKKFKWLVAVRGRKKIERFEQVDHILPTNQNWLKTPAQELQILFSVVSAQFDVNSSLIGGHMPINVWKKCVQNMLVILDILVQYPNINVDDSEEPDENETKKGADYNGSIRAEFFKSLQCIDPHTREYIERLQDEPMFGDFKGSLKVTLMRVELKPQEVYDALRTLVEPENSRTLMDGLVLLIYKYGDEPDKALAMLCHIHHHSHHDEFTKARDLLLTSHLQENGHHMDVSTQIRFNRAMSQLGLCAFPAGLVSEAHDCLSELYFGGRLKELLAQGVARSRYHKKTSEQLLESVYLISVMLLEVFNIAANVPDVKRKIISKNFSHLLEISDKKHSTVLPKMLWIMSWLSQCFLSMETSTRLVTLLHLFDVWKFVKNQDAVLEMLKDKTKEEALITTYLITFSSSSVMNDEHHARWDQPSGCIVFRNVELSMVQALAFELTEKLSILAKSNERATEAWLGSVGWIALPLLQLKLKYNETINCLKQ